MTFEEWWEKEGQKWEPSGNSSVAWMAWEAATLAEREACAQACEMMAKVCNESANGQRAKVGNHVATNCAAAIRAR